MTPSFSERMGYVPPRALQIDFLDTDARTALWNLFHECFFRPALDTSAYLEEPVRSMLGRLWSRMFRRAIDTMPEVVRPAREAFFAAHDKLEWHYVLSFAEECARIYTTYRLNLNHVLEAENIAYRLIGASIVPLTNEAEVTEVEEARRRTGATSALAGARTHIDSALEKLAQRPTPDVRNAIKEAISAVEVVARQIAEEGNTLGKALDRIDVEMNPALKQGLEKLYAWTNGPDGIRHAMMSDANLSVEDARFMIVTCSAFVTYLAVKADRRGVGL